MAIHRRLAGGVLSALTLALFVVACGGDKPETLLASARDYLAKDDAKAAVIQIKNVLQKTPDSPEARFLLGKALLKSGDPVGAEVELRKAIDAKYPADDVVPLLAQALLATGQTKKMLAELGKTELSAPEAKADLQTSIATAQAALGQMDKARAAIDAALAIKPDHAPTMMMKARVLMADRDVPGAMALVDAVLVKDDKNHEGWKLKGDILTSQQDAEQSLVAYRKAVAAKPDFGAAHAAVIAALMRQDKIDEAGTQLEAMKKALPGNPQTFLSEAEVLYQKKDFKGARDAVQEVLKVAPNHPKALLIAGSAYYQLNSLGQAEEYLAKAFKLAPGSPIVRRILAVIHLRSGQPAKALAMIEPLLEDGDGDSGLQSLAGDIYMQSGNALKAEEYFRRAAALDPKNSTKQTKVALSHLAEGKSDQAFGELERIAAGDSGISADMALIASAVKKRDFTRAMKSIDGLEKKQPDNPLVHALRGAVFVAKGDIAAGRASLEKALSLKPAYFPAAASLASLDLKDKKPDDARKRFESVLAAEPKNVQAGLALAELKARTGGSTDEVAAMIAKTIQANPAEPAPRLALVGLYLKSKDAKKAVSAAQDAVVALPDRVEVLDALAQAQQAAGDTNQALASYGKIVQLMPGSPQPYLRMAEFNLAAKAKEEAMQNLRKALELKPDLLAAQRGLIALYLDAKNIPEAQKLVREVKQQRPKEPVGFIFEGDIAAANKDWAGAVSAYKAGLKQASSTELAVKTYTALHAAGSGVEAEKFANSWLNDHAQDIAFRVALAERATARKEYPVAVKHYQILLQKQPDNPIVLNNLAWNLSQLNDARALDYAEKANKLAPNNPAIMETLGSLLSEKGDSARAIELLAKAIELAPQADTLKLSLARAQVKAGNKNEARKLLDDLAKLGDKFPRQAEVARLSKEIGN